MKKNENTIKNLLIIFALIIIVIVFLVLFIILTRSLNKEDLSDSNNVIDNSIDEDNNTLDENETNVNNTEDVGINAGESLQKITDEEIYFLVKNCMEQYYKSNNLDNPLNVMDYDVINSLKITKENYNNYNNFNFPIFRIDEIYGQELSTDVDIYVVYHQLQVDSSNSKQNVIFVKVNTNDMDFSIYPYEYLRINKYLNLKQGDKISKISSDINKNKDNVYGDLYDDDITDEDFTKELFSRYKFDLLLDIEHLYNVLDENYKKAKFPNIEDLKKYINENKSDLVIDSLSQYNAEENEEENYTKYVAICSSKEYVFYVKNLMNYTMFLDGYLMVDDKETYDSMLPQLQAEYCVKRIIQSINDGNYEFVYEKLNDIQKNNYYKNIADFKDYIQKIFYSKNKYEIDTDYLILSASVYQFNMKITDATEEEFTHRNLVMTITLKDDDDFRVSIVQKK